MISVYYDAKCGICLREINHYRLIAAEGVFDWKDVNLSREELENFGIEYGEALRFLHVRDQDGTFYIGVDAFIHMWKQLEKWKWLAPVVAFLPVKFFVIIAYRIFAIWRLRRLDHCRIVFDEKKKKL